MMARWAVVLLLATFATRLYLSRATPPPHNINNNNNNNNMDVPPSRLLQPESLGNSYILRRSEDSRITHNSTPLPMWRHNSREEEEEEEEIDKTNDENYFGGFETPVEEFTTGDQDSRLDKGQEAMTRSKRKVISRGGHYIIRSSSGSSPWSSTSQDSYSTYRTSKPRGYSWNTRGRIGDGGTRPATFGANPRQRPNRRSPRKKLTRSFKGEIAQYAILYGASKAALHYEHRVGRRLKDRVVEKFVQRYRERVKKIKKKSRS